jgi:hypothetical protein
MTPARADSEVTVLAVGVTSLVSLAACAAAAGFFACRKKSCAHTSEDDVAQKAESGIVSLASSRLNEYESFGSLPTQLTVFSLYSKDTRLDAISQFKHRLSIPIDDKILRLNQENKTLLLSVAEADSNSDFFLKELGAVIKQLFPIDIKDWEMNVNTLRIEAEVSSGIKELIQFLQQARFVLQDEQAESKRYQTVELRPIEKDDDIISAPLSSNNTSAH